MPRQGYYSGGGYRGGGYQSNFRYDNNQPLAFQYQSFYDPSRVGDFIQSSQQSGQEYDIAYAGALAAQDELAQSLVGMKDIAAKNQILNESIGDMNTTVKEKYGGDWGAAAKDIAAQVTQVRSDPFWNTAKEADRQRKIAEDLKIKYGPNAFIFNDPTKIGVMDKEGKLRGAEAFTPDIVERGDWVQTARELMSGLTADEYERFGLGKGELTGFLEGKKVSAITREKIERMASDPAIQQLFLGQHSEIRRGISELSPEQQQQHGLLGKTAQDVAYESLLGAGASAEFQSIDRSVQQNPFAVLDYKSSLAGGGGNYSPSATRQSFQTVAHNKLAEHERRMQVTAPMSLPGVGGPLGVSPDLQGKQLTVEQQAIIDKAHNEKLDTYHKELAKEYPQLKDMPRDEAFQVYEDWITKHSEQSTLAWNMKLEDSAANIKTNLISNISQGEFEVNGVTATGDVVGRKNMAKVLGYDDHEHFVTAFTAGDIELVPKVDFLNGSMALTITGNPDKPRKSQPVTLNFQADQQSRNMINTGHVLTTRMYDAKSYEGTDEEELALYDRDGRVTGVGLKVVGNADMTGGKNDKVIIWTDYNDPNPVPKQILLEDVQAMIAKTLDVRFNNFQGKLGNPGKLD